MGQPVLRQGEMELRRAVRGKGCAKIGQGMAIRERAGDGSRLGRITRRGDREVLTVDVQ